MLPAAARMRRGGDFARTIRRGRRVGQGALVVHYLPPPTTPGSADGPVRVGFVVGRAVGNSVVRHRLLRQLRHLLRDRLPEFPDGANVVVRAKPEASGRRSTSLGHDLDRALRRLLERDPTGRSGRGGAAALPPGSTR